MSGNDRLFALPRVARRDLVGRFGCPPFSTLDRRQGYWQSRRNWWLSLGVDSRPGVGVAIRDHHDDRIRPREMSLFDPVVAETMVRWYSPSDGVVLDPFAGGSVRGIVSHALGRSYYGIDVRAEQIEANEQQFDAFIAEHETDGAAVPCEWVLGDSSDPAVANSLPRADMILTCPPYGDLERYSDLPSDLSTLGYDDFAVAYRRAVEMSLDRLRDDRFAVWVVGNYRDKRTGHMRDLVGLTVDAHAEAGASYHSDLIIVDPSGTAAQRAPRTFPAFRRPLRLHQYALVFVKGDPRAAALACGPFADEEAET